MRRVKPPLRLHKKYGIVACLTHILCIHSQEAARACVCILGQMAHVVDFKLRSLSWRNSPDFKPTFSFCVYLVGCHADACISTLLLFPDKISMQHRHTNSLILVCPVDCSWQYGPGIVTSIFSRQQRKQDACSRNLDCWYSSGPLRGR